MKKIEMRTKKDRNEKVKKIEMKKKKEKEKSLFSSV